MKRTILMIAAAMVLASYPAMSGEIRVPESASTIQAGIDLAQPGDVVLVSPGWWNEAIDLKGKAITLRSRDGAKSVILDGTDLDESVVRCIKAEGPKTIIDGFTIKHGIGHKTLYGENARVGGGLVVVNASPTIRNCVFEKNDVNYNGGAVYMAQGSLARFESCTFVENAAEKGGAIYTVQSHPEFKGCKFKRNEGRYSGGAIYNSDGTTTKLQDCNFERNRASYYGGGIYEYGSRSTFDNCIFDRNRATYKGGAICNGYQGKSTIEGCKFLTNNDDVSGGGAPAVTAVAPTGACVLSDGSCLHVSRQSCDDAGGDYQGDRSDCAKQGRMRVARTSDLNKDGEIDDRDALMLLLLWR